MADKSQAAFAFWEESTWGTTPTATGQYVEIVSDSLTFQRSAGESQVIVSDRQLREVIRGSEIVQGQFVTELDFPTDGEGNSEFMEAAVAGTWAADTPATGTDRLDNGVVKRSFSFERDFIDDGDFLSFTGCRINSWGLSFRRGDTNPIQCTWGIIGKASASSTSTISSGTPSAASTNQKMHAQSHVSAFTEGGSGITTVGAFSFNVTNGLTVDEVVTSRAPYNIGYGPIRLTGSMEAWWTDLALYQKFQNFTTTAITFTLTDTAGNAVLYNIPEIKYTTGDAVVDSNTGSVLAKVDFTAQKDDSISKMIRIQRTGA